MLTLSYTSKKKKLSWHLEEGKKKQNMSGPERLIQVYGEKIEP